LDEIVKTIPSTTDPEALKALYTEATKIYLTDVPSFALMYRPSVFHTVNESVWTNYPEAGDEHGYLPPTAPTATASARSMTLHSPIRNIRIKSAD
jgi:peptide/nickel transport system substrate-binding protein